MTIRVKAGLAYFLLVFGTGFLLGMIRVPFLVPRLGVRIAELLEMPVMMVVIVFAARWVIRRHIVPPVFSARLGMGLVALALALTAEALAAFGLQGLTVAQFVASRDPVSGGVFALMLIFFALAPIWLARDKAKPASE